MIPPEPDDAKAIRPMTAGAIGAIPVDEGSTGPETPLADDGWDDDSKPSSDDDGNDGISGSDAHTKPQADDGWGGWGDDGTDEATADDDSADMEASAPDDGWDGWGDSKAGDKTAPAAAKSPSGGFHSDWRDRIGDDDASEGVFDWDDEPGGNQESEATDKAASDDGESDGTGRPVR